MIKTFCVAHKALEFDLPEDATVIWLGNDTPATRNCDNILVASEYAPDIHIKHEYLGGAAGSFIAEKFLIENPTTWKQTDLVSIIQYRKFISPIPVGRPARNYHGMYLFNEVEANIIDIDAMQYQMEGDFLISTPAGVGGVLAQYSQWHSGPDLLRYIAFALEFEIINRDDLLDFFSGAFIIPGGIEFGIFPIPIYLDVIAKLRRICFEFLKIHKPASNDPYQQRALAFCNERLGGYLLIKQLKSIYPGEIFDRFFGYMHCLSDNDIYK